jgi:hypothetical protein
MTSSDDSRWRSFLRLQADGYGHCRRFEKRRGDERLRSGFVDVVVFRHRSSVSPTLKFNQTFLAIRSVKYCLRLLAKNSTLLRKMGKRDSDSGHSPSIGNEKGVYDGEAQHAEQVASLDRFPDPDEGKSEEERALIVCYAVCDGL